MTNILCLHSTDGSIVIHVPKADAQPFKNLIQRGANLWPDAPPEIKEFADLVTNGRVLQDYHAQNKDQRAPRKSVPIPGTMGVSKVEF